MGLKSLDLRLVILFSILYSESIVQNKPLALLIMDGWGIKYDYKGNAVTKAKTPNVAKFWQEYPHTKLEASSQAVGLPINTEGNSETGHTNIGAGRIVEQDLVRINNSINDGSFFSNKAFLLAIDHAKKNNSNLHLMGLVSKGRVHSSLDHLFALLEVCKQQHFTRVFIHAFTDGRDSSPTSSLEYLEKVKNKCQELSVGKIVSVMGRLYAMDRDNQWARVEKAYDCLTLGNNQCHQKLAEYIQSQYNQQNTDEFIMPANLGDDDKLITINDNDAVIFYNFRIDRARELTKAFAKPDFNGFSRKKVVNNLLFITMSEYEKNLPVLVAFPNQKIEKNLGQVLADNNLKQLRITETEKEKMVGYYINGASETIYAGEDRKTIPSKGAKSYSEVPEMSAKEVAETVINDLKQNGHDVYIINLANPDMVGHTGDMKAAITACEVVDEQVGIVVTKVLEKNGTVLITADHGNVEEMINEETGEIDTKHSTSPVPFIVINNELQGTAKLLPMGILADIAPTILNLLNIPQPAEMTGKNLVL